MKDNVGTGRTYMMKEDFDAEVTLPTHLSFFSESGQPPIRVVGQKSDIVLRYSLRVGLGTSFKLKLDFEKLNVFQATATDPFGSTVYTIKDQSQTTLDLDVSTISGTGTPTFLLNVSGIINNVG